MTSNVTPSGEASSSSVYGNNEAYFAFDGSTGNAWTSADGKKNNSWVKYAFTTVVSAKAFSLNSGWDSSHKAVGSYIIQGSKDDNSWIDLYSGTNSNTVFNLKNIISINDSYKYFRVYIISSLDSTNAYVNEFQIYGRK